MWCEAMVDNVKTVRLKQYRNLFIGVGGFFVLLLFGMWLSDPNRGKPTALEQARAKASVVNKNYADGGSNVSAEDRWVAKSEQALMSSQRALEETQRKNADLERKMTELENRLKAQTENGAGTAPERREDMPQRTLPPVPESVRVQSSPVYPPAPGSPALNDEGLAGRAIPQAPNAARKQGQLAGIFEISLEDDKPAGEKDAVKKSDHYIPSGSFVTAVMLAGVDAPTGGLAQSNPAPVLLRLKEDARLPNFFRSEIQECLIVGAGAGDLSSERVNVRLEKMSCVLANGDVLEKKVKGWVTGEDGKSGIRGRVVSKQGRMIAMAALSGVASGLGMSVNDQYTQTSTSALGTVSTIDPNKALEAGAAKGFSTSMEKISDYFMKRADETYPIIEASAKRVVEVVFSEGVDFGLLVVNGNTRHH